MNPNTGFDYDLEQDVHRITLYSTVARDHQHAGMKKRMYLHLDMNCFYAQVEQRAYNLYGLPLAMGGWRKPDGTPRGIVATASYEARALGIETAMSALDAQQICPYVVFMQIDYDKYKGISRELQTIMERHAPTVEKYSMDEYFMDVSHIMKRGREGIQCFVDGLKNDIYRRLGLVSSVGVAMSKTYSKLASSLRKPDGVSLILSADDVARELFPLPLNKVWGIGSRRYDKLLRRGLRTIADAHKAGPSPFEKQFGKMQGRLFYEIVTGRDRGRVMDAKEHIPDEVSYMHTFSDWTDDPQRVKGELIKAIAKMCYRMRGYKRWARRWGCHIRLQDAEWKGYSFVFQTPGYTNLDYYVRQACLPEAIRTVKKAFREGHTIRGIGLHTIDMIPMGQTELFFQEDEEVRRLHVAADRVNNVYGAGTVFWASSAHDVPGKTHFVSR